MASILTKILGGDKGADSLLTKINALFDHRHSRDWATKTANYTVALTDQGLYLDAAGGAFTVTLPASPTAGENHLLKVKSVAGGNITLAGNGKNIDGAANKTLSTQYQALSVEYDDAAGAWFILTN